MHASLHVARQAAVTSASAAAEAVESAIELPVASAIELPMAFAATAAARLPWPLFAAAKELARSPEARLAGFTELTSRPSRKIPYREGAERLWGIGPRGCAGASGTGVGVEDRMREKPKTKRVDNMLSASPVERLNLRYSETFRNVGTKLAQS